MTVTLSWQTIITAGAVISAVTAISVLLARFVRWVDRQKQQDQELANLRAKHEADNSAICEELQLMTFGLLACLKGLSSQGCNGPVTEAISKFEKFINQKAHKEVHK